MYIFQAPSGFHQNHIPASETIHYSIKSMAMRKIKIIYIYIIQNKLIYLTSAKVIQSILTKLFYKLYLVKIIMKEVYSEKHIVQKLLLFYIVHYYILNIMIMPPF